MLQCPPSERARRGGRDGSGPTPGCAVGRTLHANLEENYATIDEQKRRIEELLEAKPGWIGFFQVPNASQETTKKNTKWESRVHLQVFWIKRSPRRHFMERALSPLSMRLLETTLWALSSSFSRQSTILGSKAQMLSTKDLDPGFSCELFGSLPKRQDVKSCSANGILNSYISHIFHPFCPIWPSIAA